MITIREAKEQDIDMIYSCIRGLAEHVNQLELVTAKKEDLLQEIFSPNSHVLVLIAENEKNEVTGFSLFFKPFRPSKLKPIFLSKIYLCFLNSEVRVLAKCFLTAFANMPKA